MKRTVTSVLSLLALGGAMQAQTVFVNEDFEGGQLPTDWVIETAATDGGFTFETAEQASSQFFPIPDNGTNLVAVTNDDDCNCDKSNDMLITPSMDLSGVTNLYLEAQVFFPGATFQGNTESANLVYTEDNGQTWNLVGAIQGDGTNWQYIATDISGISTGTDVRFAFQYNDGTGWLFGMAVDDVKIYEPNDWDVTLTGGAIDRFAVDGNNVEISGGVINIGVNPVTNITVEWSDGVTTMSQNVAVNLNPLEGTVFTHPDMYNIPSTGDHNLTMTITSLDGNMDADMSNNTTDLVTTGLSFLPPRKVIVEEATGTWCGWCPRGEVGLKYMHDNYPNSFIGIAVHNSDPMEVSEWDDNMGVGGYPSSNMDRFYNDTDPNAANLEALYNARMDIAPLATAEVSYTLDEETWDVDINVKSKFAAGISNGTYRFNAFILEDNVTGTDQGYAQANYYSGGGNGAMGGYENLADPVPAADMVYNHVGRALLGGFDGVDGSVPSTIAVDQEVDFDFSYTIPASADPNNFTVVGVLLDNSTGEIVNADAMHITYAADTVDTTNDDTTNTGIAQLNRNFSVNVFPNPFQVQTDVRLELKEAADVQMTVTNILGEVVAQRAYGELTGTQLLPFVANNLDAGVYMINLQVGDERISRRVLLTD